MEAIWENIRSGFLPAQIGVVISDNPQAPALEKAAAWKIPGLCVRPGDFNGKVEFENALTNELRRHQVDLVVLAGFMRILSAGFIQEFSGRILNIHPSLLPAFPGLNAQEQAWRYGVKVAGCTVHFVDEGMDTGPIILQEAVPVGAQDTVEMLADRILTAEHAVYSHAIKLYCEGRLQIEGRRVKIL
jgi:phosphoribosylglycinamide formyltransferase-1